MALIRTRDTERVATKMKEEVLPEIMKLRPDIIKQMREASPESFESNMMENNPEWEEIMEKSGLSKKMQELSDLQSDGADLMMVAFSNLKQFPFFNIASNWFLPFNVSHSAINAGEKERETIEKIMEIGRNVCDSDKYSLAIALGKMPESQKQMLISQIDAQFNQFSEEIKDREFKSSAPEFDEEVTKVIRDLYRFFKLFRKKEGFDDPFKSPFNFLEIPVLGDMMSDVEIVTLVGEFYFKRKYYAEALSLFNNLAEENPTDAALWEKIGFCYQSMKFYEKAIEAYNHAELLKTPGTWLLRNLAYCNKKTGNFEAALDYYSTLLEENPEDMTLLLNAGYCAMEAGKPDKALKHYYHANYIESDNLNILRAIAWSEFLLSNFDKSLIYYERILNSEPQTTDFLNIGHMYFIKGDLKKALEFYLKASEENYDNFREAFLNDLEILVNKGAEKENVYILLD
ncbi:MAG: tetratricopeptide repeat protein, partial [Muribaculaceae bacterium]|nr:tetratricopeptide repeat protein [Muribaculaceae bacterium]